ncbi:MAG: hypothetical protein AAGD38_03685 [Acidobacteriota bacterium]
MSESASPLTPDDHEVIDRYLRGELDSESSERFEVRLLAEPALLDGLETAEAFARGIKTAATQEMVATAAAAATIRRRRFAQLAGMVALAVMLLIPSVVLVRDLQNVDRELDVARDQVAAADQRAEEAERRADDAEARRSTDADRRDTEIDQQLAALRSENQRLEQQIATPSVNVPVLTLAPERSAANQPSQRLTLGDSGSVVFLLEVALPVASRYGVVLRQDDTVLWRGEDLVPDSLDTLTISVPSSLLRTGVHTFEAKPSDGSGSTTRLRFDVENDLAD